ncbi:hypothetical protein M1N23_01190 [Dehalococcoidia bacterium]|nr:hypothetical protein [Dehalococcoidia bacterium]
MTGDDILAIHGAVYQRCIKDAFLKEPDESGTYISQHVDDPMGDTEVSASVILHDSELAISFANALEAEGMGVATIYNDGFPARHIYSYWDSILENGLPTRQATLGKTRLTRAISSTPMACVRRPLTSSLVL